ncbi:MAG: hypothetical protein V1779_12940 [bacterium]
MNTRTYYENLILRNIKKMPDNYLPALYNIFNTFSDMFKINDNNREKIKSTGFCGAWEDNRTAEEIIADIENSRTGYGNREIEL